MEILRGRDMSTMRGIQNLMEAEQAIPDMKN